MIGAAAAIGVPLLLNAVGKSTGLIGQTKNQKDTLRDLKAAQDNLKGVQEQGVTSTLTPEMKEAMTLAMKEYTDAKSRSGYGFSPEETAAYKTAIDRNQTSQITAAGEAGGGQMASYVGALSSANKADNILDMMSKNATLKLQKEQFAANQLSPVIGMAKSGQEITELDTNRYTNLLASAGKAVSDLRMQKAGNRERIFNTAGNIFSSTGSDVAKGAEQYNKAQSASGSNAGSYVGNIGTSPSGQDFTGKYSQNFGGD
jgi:hypothetical protein